jgi:hypothetical protein
MLPSSGAGVCSRRLFVSSSDSTAAGDGSLPLPRRPQASLHVLAVRV